MKWFKIIVYSICFIVVFIMSFYLMYPNAYLMDCDEEPIEYNIDNKEPSKELYNLCLKAKKNKNLDIKLVRVHNVVGNLKEDSYNYFVHTCKSEPNSVLIYVNESDNKFIVREGYSAHKVIDKDKLNSYLENSTKSNISIESSIVSYFSENLNSINTLSNIDLPKISTTIVISSLLGFIVEIIISPIMYFISLLYYTILVNKLRRDMVILK